MKKHFRLNNIKGSYFLWLFMAPVFLLSCNAFNKPADTDKNTHVTNESHDMYYCPMHPEIQQEHPGICPKPECDGMDLVKKRAPELLRSLLKPINETVVSNIKTVHPEERSLPAQLKVQGYIDYDNRTKHNIASRFSGRIEKLYIRYNYQTVAKGERIFDIYSADLITAQENYLYLLRTDPDETNMVNAAAQKLRLLGFTEEQTNNLKEKKTVMQTVPVYSRWDGHIHENMTEKNNNQLQNSTELQVKEGMYVSAGETIFNIVNPHALVIILQLKSKDMASIKLNDVVEYIVDETPTMIMYGKINFIEPYLEQGAKTIKARVDLPNNEHSHKVGTLVNATINTGKLHGLWIPKNSVLDLGKENMVWVKKDGYFKAQKITTGNSANGLISVIEGIYPSDEIAADASYLSDSESFIKITNDEQEEE